MITQKIAELYFQTNDVYILDNYNNTVIINDNSQGLLLLDNALHIKKELPILQETPIYSLYKKYDGNAIILYLPDAHQITYVDLKTPNSYTISLPKAFEKDILSPNYYWDNDILILTTVNNDFYQFNFASKMLLYVPNDAVQKVCPSFFDFWNTCKKYNILTFYPDKQSFIFQKDNNILGFFIYQENKEHTITGFTNGWHDVEYNNELFLFIHENKIELLNDNHKNFLNPYTNFIFLKAKFLNDNQFVVLSSNPSNSQENLLEIYKLLE